MFTGEFSVSMVPSSASGRLLEAVPYVYSLLPPLCCSTSFAESREGSFCTYMDVPELHQQHRQPEKWKIVCFPPSPPMSVLIPTTSWTIVTSTFSHQDIGHIFLNMFTFYFLGRYLLEGLGNRQFLFLYLGGMSLHVPEGPSHLLPKVASSPASHRWHMPISSNTVTDLLMAQAVRFELSIQSNHNFIQVPYILPSLSLDVLPQE